jgi:hypothetical protein
MVGKMREARCKMPSRYSRATSTGLGRVLVTKFTRACKRGSIFGRREALSAEMGYDGISDSQKHDLL